MTFFLNDIVALLSSENITFFTKENRSDLKINRLSFIFKSFENSLVYYTNTNISSLELSNCTLICPIGTETTNKTINYVFVENPKVAFYIAAQLFSPKHYKPGIHGSAIVHSSSIISPYATIGANVVIEPHVTIGAYSNIHPNTVIYSNTQIGNYVTVEANSSIGGTGTFWTWDKKGKMWQLPQLGAVKIGNNCFIGANVVIIRACYEREFTSIEEYCKLANASRIEHDCLIKSHTQLSNNTSLGGKVILNNRCFLGTGVSVRSGVELAEDTIVGTGAVVVKDYTESRLTLVGNPAKPMQRKSVPSGMNAPLYEVQNDKEERL